VKFYELDSALEDAVKAADKPVRIKILIEYPWGNESVFEQDIIEADFYGLREAAGGTSSRGEILIDNERRIMNNREGAVPGTKVRVFFTIGEGLPWMERFVFYIDDKGIQDIRGPGRRSFARLGLRDLSARLRKTDEERDWTNPAVFTYSVICDKTQPDRSLVHGIAKRAGLGVSDIDCATIPVTIPYVRLTRNIWEELSGLALAYRCHLECAPEKPLVFAHSPYQAEPLEEEEYSYTFTGEDIFYLRETSRAELYRNTVRLKINLPVVLERREIWRYDEQPLLYDESLREHFPFKYPYIREIEAGGYEARYRITDTGGRERAVVYADGIDTKEEAESRLVYEEGPFVYSVYDVTSHKDKAIINLCRADDGDLYTASIYGRPIVLDLNRSCFMNDEKGIASRGTAALNVSGLYFSEYEVKGKPHYEDWAGRELEERIKDKREITVKTHRGLFNGRVGAKVKIVTKAGPRMGTINAFHLRYRKHEAFSAGFKIIE
jgi:hypothetical protein